MPATETAVIQTTKREVATTEPPKKAFEKKKTIFRFYQVVWYVLGIAETLMLMRFVFKALGASQISGFTSFIYAITQPLTLPFQGIFPTQGSTTYIIEWSTIVAMIVYALVAYALVQIPQFIKPVSQEEVEQTVDEQ